MSTPTLKIPLLRTRRWAYFGLVAATTITGVALMVGIVSAEGVSLLEVFILLLFAPTFAWITAAFWTAVIGFLLRLFGRDPITLRRIYGDRKGSPVHPLRAEVAGAVRRAPEGDVALGGDRSPIQTRTALVMPAYNEDPARVMEALGATLDSLHRTGHLDAFDLFLLSDSTDPEVIRKEEIGWERFRTTSPYPDRLHYRRRARNVGRKAGNVAEFCHRHGDRYDFTVVLDADSVMSGRTLVELVRIMEANPGVGLVQTVPVPARQRTLFGRLVQFAASVHSPVLATGQSFWQADAANYWGHNAILRTRPFREHCRLPVLPGRPPLGGEILSHDFVEAALLRRAGWDVLLVPELDGSYEEVPNNLLDYATRDRRWAQGSIQHLRLLGLPNLHPLSRIHFLMGAMGYLSSCLWFLMLLAGTVYVMVPAAHSPILLGSDPSALLGWSSAETASWFSLLAVTAVILFLPKLLGIVLALTNRPEAYGGGSRLVASGFIEILYAVVVAPVMMLFHTRFVLDILRGRNVAWTPQERGRSGVAWSEAVRKTLGIAMIGALWAGVTLFLSVGFFLWLTPILVGLVLAAVIVRWTSSHELGIRARDVGLLLVPTETAGRTVGVATGEVRELLDEAQVLSGRAG